LLYYQKQALEQTIETGQIETETLINIEIGKTLLAKKDLTEASLSLKRGLTLSLDGQHTQNSLKALIYWSLYLIACDRQQEGLTLLYFIQSHSAITQDDEKVVSKTIKVLSKLTSEEFCEQAKSEATQIELEPLIESILNEPIPMPPPRTIDSTELTASL